MKLTSLLQLVDTLQQTGKIDNLQQIRGVFGCVDLKLSSNLLFDNVDWLENMAVSTNRFFDRPIRKALCITEMT